MNTTKNALGTLKARDIMRSNVFKLEPGTTVEEAVTSFAELHISGAPVVDRNGRLVGVLSAFDIARPENLRNGRLEGSGGEYPMGDASNDDYDDEDVSFSMEDYSPDVLQSATVSELMSTEVVSIAPDMPLKQICALFVKEHIHRAMVVEHGKLVGIVTTLDIARAVSEAL